MENTWNQITDILSKSMAPGLYNLWIKPLAATVPDGKTIDLKAPNDFVAAWVRERLLDVVAEAAATVMNGRPRIRVAAEGPVRPQPHPRQGETACVRAGERALELPLPGQSEFTAAAAANFRFRFDDFVVGPSNELAYAASKGICEQKLATDQLFISSEPGLGKTHLMQAMGRRFAGCCNRSRVRVMYLTAEEFSNRLVMAIKAREVERFKASIREHVDVLLLEDIHFFKDKPRIQDELLNTLKVMRGRGCKLVFTSSFLPKELSGLDNQLQSRFCSGFLAIIDKPDVKTRKRILERKAAVHQVLLPENVAELLAERFNADIRLLESCIQNLALKARLLNSSITMDMARQVLCNYKLEQPGPGLEEIVDYICDVYGITDEQLASKSRKRQLVMARNTAFFLARKHTDMSLADIGRRFNRRHSTVVKGITSLEREINLRTPRGRELKKILARISS